MHDTRILMVMPVTVDLRGSSASAELLERVSQYFQHFDAVFSPYKEQSEISRINRGEIFIEQASGEMQDVLRRCEETKQLSGGYFDIQRADDTLDPSGLVKGWVIWNAAQIVRDAGCEQFFIDAGGDIQTGISADQMPWRIGIRNPFKREENIKILSITNQGVATSGTYIRGQHIYNPHKRSEEISEIVSLTVVGPNIYDADRYATAAFAMGQQGVHFIERLPGFESYQVNARGIAVMTSGFERFIAKE